MMRLVYLCDWLPPDFGAVGQYSLGFAREWAETGREVTLVGLTSAAQSRLQSERIGAGRLTVRRIPRTMLDRSGHWRRAWWTLVTNIRLFWAARREILAADEVLITGAPPFLLHLLVPLNVLLRKRLIYRITDFHPECLMAELGSVPAWLRWFHRYTVQLRRYVDQFEVLGVDQKSRLLEIGIEPERIVLKRDPSPVSIRSDTVPLPRPPELSGKVVLLYSGNFGVAHDDATFVEGYTRHHREGSGRVVLWLNATGAKADRVEGVLRQRGLPVHRTQPVPLEQLASLLVTPDAHLITLRDEFVGYVLPSKVYGCIASGKPVLFVGSGASDVALLCKEHLPSGRYWRVEPGDSGALGGRLESIGSESRTD